MATPEDPFRSADDTPLHALIKEGLAVTNALNYQRDINELFRAIEALNVPELQAVAFLGAFATVGKIDDQPAAA